MDLLSLIFPIKCLGCGREGNYLCQDCLEKSKRQWLVCPECGKLSPIGQTHDTCRTKYGLDGLISLYKYRGVVKKAIGALKYKFAHGVARDLVSISGESLANISYIKSPVIVPIPLFRVRKNWRGFNQSEEIGKILAQNLNWDFNNELLLRIRHKKPQVGLTNEERLRNISGEYAVNIESLALNNDLKSKTITLFDDVWTTGSTIKEACRELKQNGFKHVWGVTIAR